MKPLVLCSIVALGVLIAPPPTAGAVPPADCPAAATEPDWDGDYRCAGLLLAFHTGGVDRSTSPIWAGQWLFVDQAGEQHAGWCTFNRGVHPSVLGPSMPIVQALPNDPGGAKSGYLAWRYRWTNDDLTAAALWAVFHFYAQDPAGSARSDDPQAPLIPTLATVGMASGRTDVEQRAIALDAEAARFAVPWALELAWDGTAVAATLRSGDAPVAGHLMQISVADRSLSVTTGDDGRARVELAGEAERFAVVAIAEAPGAALVWRGPPADPGHPFGAQTLIGDGPPIHLRAEAFVELAPPTTSSTTTSTTTTTEVPPTSTTISSVSSTSVLLAPPATVITTTTAANGATSTESTTTTEVAASPPATTPTTVGITSASMLPVTGHGRWRTGYLATLATVAGVGLLGAVRRRSSGPPTDPFWG